MLRWLNAARNPLQTALCADWAHDDRRRQHTTMANAHRLQYTQSYIQRPNNTSHWIDFWPININILPIRNLIIGWEAAHLVWFMCFICENAHAFNRTNDLRNEICVSLFSRSFPFFSRFYTLCVYFDCYIRKNQISLRQYAATGLISKLNQLKPINTLLLHTKLYHSIDTNINHIEAIVFCVARALFFFHTHAKKILKCISSGLMVIWSLQARKMKI